ncbi:MAG: chromate efflux transporter [Planctomycetales bacterium]|nr:chromate efflux transporter [Planctomycetales bacterium]
MVNPPSTHPTFLEAFWVWCRVAALSFGGPTAQIAVMHRVLVEEKKWISEHRFLHALNYCMLLPGPEAQQLAVYIGWLLHGTRGGLVAGTLFILPGFVAIMVLSILYVLAQSQDATVLTHLVAAVFYGLKPAVAAIVTEAVIRIGKKVLKNRVMVAIAALAFVGIFFFELPFPVIILAAGVTGFVGGKLWPKTFQVIKQHGEGPADEHRAVDAAAAKSRPTVAKSLLISAVWLTLWFAPLGFLAWRLGADSVFVKEGIFFSQAAVMTFGGAYSVLSYIGQKAVHHFGWLKPAEMMDGLGMAETTPGPLIMVVQFVGFMGAYRNPGSLPPLAAGMLGAVITVWVTFVPCFFWIFLGAPYIERLRGDLNLSAALSSITAAVVGVVLNLAIWFGIHVLFADVSEVRANLLTGETKVTSSAAAEKDLVSEPPPLQSSFYQPHLRWFWPAWSSTRLGNVLLLFAALLLIFRFHQGMLVTLASCVAAGVLLYILGL